MAVPTYPSAISLNDIQTEFGGSGEIGINEYYAGGSYVGSGTANSTGTAIPTSGQISFLNFSGASAGYTFSATISANTTGYDIRAAAIANGWNGTTRLIATITINSGVYVGAVSTSGFAIDTNSSGTFPTGTTISIVNNGQIQGASGSGGNGGSATVTSGGTETAGSSTGGTAGGKALKLRYATSITNNGTIGGGGGGGGGGGAAAWNNGNTTGHALAGGGGGGGHGYASGSGGSNGSQTETGITSYYSTEFNNTGNNPGAGSPTAPGSGSGGSNAGIYTIISFKTTYVVYGTGGTGGGGGSLGSSGGSGTNGAFYDGQGWSTSNGSSGGGGGNYIEGSSFATWVATGTRYGGST